MNDDRVRALANAIMARAAEDYIILLKAEKRYIRKLGKGDDEFILSRLYDIDRQKEYLERWFHGQWAELLSEYDVDMIIDQCRKRAEYLMREKK